MKKLTLTAIASACAVAAVVWSVPASAETAVFSDHDKKPESYSSGFVREQMTTAPEPGTMALLVLGLGGLALAPLRRRRKD